MKTKIPEWLKEYVLGMGQFEYKDEIYEYVIVSSSLSKAFGDNAPQVFTIFTDGVLAVTDTCPEMYRELVLLHEIIENPDREDLPEDSCLKALKLEINIAIDKLSDFDAYIKFRLEFFSGLLRYYRDKERDQKEEKLYKRLERSYYYLHDF